MSKDWRDKLRESVEKAKESMHRAGAEVCKVRIATIDSSGRLTREDMAEAVEMLGRERVEQGSTVECDTEVRIPPAALKALANIGASGGTLANWGVRSRLIDLGLVKERHSFVLTDAGRRELVRRGLPAEGMTDEELDAAEREWLERNRPIDADPLLSSLREAKRLALQMRDDFHDLASTLARLAEWEEAFRRSVTEALDRRSSNPDSDQVVRVVYTDDLPREVVLECVRSLAEDLGLVWDEDLSQDSKSSGFVFRRRSP